MTYTIQRGDTLSALAKRYNTTVSALKNLNGIRDINKIYAGDTLLLPEGETSGWSSTTRASGDYGPSLNTGGAEPFDQSAALRELSARLNNTTPTAAYQSAYADRIAAALDSLENREAFSYDYADDPLYAQYKDSYTQGGKLAMQDAMGNATALTGGYGSTYAQNVGQQTYQAYMRALGDKIPELEASAYEKYKTEEDALLEQLSRYGELDAADYAKYRDGVTDAQTERAFTYQQYRDAQDDEYRRYQSQLDAWLQQQSLAREQAQDAQSQHNWEMEFARKQSADALKAKGTRDKAEAENTAEADSIYALFETMTPDERSFLFTDAVSLDYMQRVLGKAGFAALKAKYAGREK